MGSIYRHQTAYGLAVIGYYLPGITAAAGIIAGSGSAWEESWRRGVSHVIEQAAFQATRRRSGADLRDALERSGLRIGTALNPEWIRYWIVGLSDDLPAGLRLLGECALLPSLDEEDTAAARDRAQAQLRRRRQQRELHVSDLLREGLYPGHPLGRPTLGTSTDIAAVTASAAATFHVLHHRAGNLTLAVAGQFDWDEVVDAAEGYVLPCPARPARRFPPTTMTAARISEFNPGSHQHVAIAIPGPAYQDAQFYAWALVTQVLGVGQTSRLFRQVREEQGMTYAVSARLVAHSCGGEVLICGTTAPERAQDFAAAVCQVVSELASTGLSSGELATAKAQLASELVMRGESSVARMHTLLTSVLYTGEPRGIDEIGALIDRVRPDDIAAVLASLRDGATIGLATAGPLSAEELSHGLEPAKTA
jgi:predicted Zn-dependent peptidase